MQRKQQVGECWVCVIFFARVVVSGRYVRRIGGLEGGAGGGSPLHGGAGGSAPGKKNPASGNVTPFRETCHLFRWFFGTWFLPMVFYFQLMN
jgi:hypothetical protein